MADRQYGRLYNVAKSTLGPLSRALWRTHVTGLHHVPKDGGAIICPNHISFLDSPLLMFNLPRRITYVGKAEYLDDWKTKYLFPAVGMIPLDRSGGKKSMDALDVAAGVLDGGELFGIFPEGTRSRNGLLHRGHTGAARLALRCGVPIVPVGIRGTDQIQPPDAAMPNVFTSCQLNFGRPIDVTRYLDRADDRLVLRQIIDEVMFSIRDLSGQQYVDTYATKKTEPPAPKPTRLHEPQPERGRPVLPAAFQPVPALAGGHGHGGDGDGEVLEVVGERRSSSDVLAQWWS
jgi:1-acyl-sn-glycerol-3-phosphate acyltransferase